MPTVPDELTDFVKSALARGVGRNEIETALRGAGWTADQTRSALAGFADTSFPIPIPKPKPYLDARDAFLYLVLFTTMYWSAFHFGSLMFNIIDITLPDPAIRGDTARYIRSAIRWSISSLVVAFPVFLYMSWLVGRDISTDPNKRHSKIRRWLTYMTLFFAASILIGDVITLVYNLLGGEITTRFVLKVLVVAFVAGTVFWYYLSDIRREE